MSLPCVIIDTMLQINCELDHQTILANQAQPVHLAIQFRATERPEPRDTPCAFTLVIDSSGSMAGSPIEFAKQAAQLVVKNLRPEDYFSLVTFENHAQTLIPIRTVGTKRKPLLDIIRNIQAFGSTNLTAGWMLGRDELAQAPNEAKRKLILLSDGMLNEGITDPERVTSIVASGTEKQRIHTSTVGFGLHYDEFILRNLAKHALGEFYHINSPEHISPVFQSELDGLLHMTASNLRVRCTPGMFCDSILQCSDYPETNHPKNAVEITIGDLTSNEERSLVLALDIPPLPTMPNGKPGVSLEGEHLPDLLIRWDEIESQSIQSHTYKQTIRISSTQNPDDIKLNTTITPIIAAQLAAKTLDDVLHDIIHDDHNKAQLQLKKLLHTLQKYGDIDSLTDAAEIIRKIKHIINSTHITPQQSKEATYHSKSVRSQSSTTMWTQLDIDSTPSFKTSIITDYIHPQAKPKTPHQTPNKQKPSRKPKQTKKGDTTSNKGSTKKPKSE